MLNKIVPVFCGSAFKNKGVQCLLDGVIDFLPSPADKESVKGVVDDGSTKAERKATDEEPFSALAFKIATDPFVGILTFIQSVFRGFEVWRCSFKCSKKQKRTNRSYRANACEQPGRNW